MKGKVALLVLGVGLLATGCGSAQADGPENISFDDGESSIVVDSKTGVEYIKTEIITKKAGITLIAHDLIKMVNQ